MRKLIKMPGVRIGDFKRLGRLGMMDDLSARTGHNLLHAKSVQLIQEGEFDPAISYELDSKTRYVCGFLFDSKMERVLLIRKKKPKWQEGKLNGVGGHIEDGEGPLEAMVREFNEEIGIEIRNWNELARVSGEGFEVNFFWTRDKNWIEDIDTGNATEDVVIVATKSIQGLEVIPNLKWLIPMALDPQHSIADCVTV